MSNINNIYDLASVIRSKSSSPFEVTFDIIFNDKDVYRKVKLSNSINKSVLSSIFSVKEEDISDVVYYDAALAVKFNMPRRTSIASFGENDMHAAQQHVPLSLLKIELD
jgi:hypothetical protein